MREFDICIRPPVREWDLCADIGSVPLLPIEVKGVIGIGTEPAEIAKLRQVTLCDLSGLTLCELAGYTICELAYTLD